MSLESSQTRNRSPQSSSRLKSNPTFHGRLILWCRNGPSDCCFSLSRAPPPAPLTVSTFLPFSALQPLRVLLPLAPWGGCFFPFNLPPSPSCFPCFSPLPPPPRHSSVSPPTPQHVFAFHQISFKGAEPNKCSGQKNTKMWAEKELNSLKKGGGGGKLTN